MRRPLEKYGFALLVVMALACAIYFAGSVAVPEPIPDYALQAAEIYRLEIGAAFFVAIYLAILAFLLALSGRGFAEFGTKGLKIQQVVERSENGFLHQAEIDRQTRLKLRELDADVEEVRAMVITQQKSLEKSKTSS
jgi:hypothetical protein